MKLSVMLAFLAVAIASHAQEITVAAAADLRPAMEEMISRFQGGQGQSDIHVKIKAIYGSSGNFFEQIRSGAPFDLFFSANTDYPKKLETAGLTVAGTYYEYARGKIVLLVTANSNLDVKRGLSLLLDFAVKKIAIANPSHAPYGQAAVAAMKHEGIYDKVSEKLVTAENISQVSSFVLSGAADVGIAAFSIATSIPASQARFAEIPAEDYPPIQQACVILSSSKNKELASKFQAYVRSDEGRAVLERHGFEVPEKH
jgi:molybdenum ABC transporter, periplasmic molybdate-binding protein